MTPLFKMHFRSFGTGSRDVLAIHCTLSHGGAWRGMACAHPYRWNIRACDLPGHGKSDAWDGVSNLLEVSLLALSQTLEKPVDVIGHSFGAVVALRLAQEYPDHVNRLCLFEPVLFAASALTNPEVLAAYKQQTIPIAEAFSRNDLSAAARLFNRTWGDGRPWDEIPPHTRDYITARMPLIDAQEAILLEDTTGILKPDALARVTMPVLLLCGADSPTIAHTNASALATRLPRVHQAMVAGAGHMAPITHAQDVADAFIRFLEKTEEEIDVLFGD